MSLLHTFYTAFAQRDWATMGACYHPDARFSDPVFPGLDAQRTRAMWKMLLSSGTDLTIRSTVLEEDARGGRVRWEAFYTFSRSGRKVHNVIDTRITLKDGLIITQRDHFSLWRWSRQALGVQGLLLGWTPLLRNKVRGMAAASLRKFMAADATAAK